ncbi:MAG: alpha-2-macroglobulin family protein [Anaerolineae bacterium]
MSHLEMELLAYLDGELSPAEQQAVEAHLAGCPACTAELVELQALRVGLHTVVPEVYETVHLSATSEARIRRALALERARQAPVTRQKGWWAGLLRGLQPLGKAAIPLMVAFFFGMTFRAAQLPVQGGAQQTLVLGQNTFAPGSPAALRVVVNDASNNLPIANANIAVEMRQAGLAKMVYSGQTDANGTAPVQFDVPADWEGDAELVVATDSALGQDEVVTPVQLKRSYRVLLSSDKPVYQPGETIHLRTLALSGVDGKPAAGSIVQFEIFDAVGRVLLSQQQLSSAFGIAALDLPLAASAPLGQYQIKTTLGDTVSELSVTLGEAPLPNFLVDVATDHPYYLSGDTIRGTLNASYFFGQPAAGAQVALRLIGERLGDEVTAGTQQQFVQVDNGTTDDNGQYRFEFRVPDLPAAAFDAKGIVNLQIEANVVDVTGDAEFGWKSLTLAREPLLIAVTPEDGTLHAGVENVLYVLVSTPDGSPTEAQLQVKIGSGAVIEAVTNEYGLAQIRYTPRSGETDAREITITATTANQYVATSDVTLPLNEAQATLLLRTDRALYQVGDTLAAEVIATGNSDVVYVDVIKAGQTLLTQAAPVKNGKASFGIDLTPALAGTLELNAYQISGDATVLRDTRVALVDAPETLQVQLATDQNAYAPGSQAKLDVATTADGAGVQTAVGLAVVNEAVYGQRAYQPGFTRAYFLLDQALQAKGITLPQAAASDDPALMQQAAAQQQAAQASWASYSGRDYSLNAQSVDQSGAETVNLTRRLAFTRLSQAVTLALSVIPLLAALIVLFGLYRSQVLGKAVGRLLLTAILLAVVGAGLIYFTQLVLNNLPPVVGWLVLGSVGALWIVLLLALLVNGWRRKDQRLQFVGLLTLAYGALLALLAFAANEGARLNGVWMILLAAGFGAMLVTLGLFGWGLRLEGRKQAGLALLLLMVLVLPLVTAFSALNPRGAALIRQVAGPTLTGLSNGLFVGCAAPSSPANMNQAPAADQVASSVQPEGAVDVQPAAKEITPTQQVQVTEDVIAVPEGVIASEEITTPLTSTLTVVMSPSPEATADMAASNAPITPTLPQIEARQMLTSTVEAEVSLFAAPITNTDVSSSSAILALTQPLSQTLTLSSAPLMTQTQPLTSADLRVVEPAPTETVPVIVAPSPTSEVQALAQSAPFTATLEPSATAELPTVTPEPPAAPEPTATPEPPAAAPPPAVAAPQDTPTPEPSATPELVITPTVTPTVTPTRTPPAPEIPLEALPIVRERFPQTLYWNPEAITDERGHLSVTIPTGDAITTWRVTALAVDRDGRLGSAVAPLTVFKSLFLTANIPNQMRPNNQLDLRIQVFNYSTQPQTVRLTAEASSGLQVELNTSALVVPANAGAAVTARLIAIGSGPQSLTLRAEGRNTWDMRQATVVIQGP